MNENWNGAISRREMISVLPVAMGGLWLATRQSADAAAQGSPGPSASTEISAGAPDPVLVQDLVVANRILADKGFLDTNGHVSVRHNLNPNHYLLSWRKAPELVTADDIVEHDLDGNAIGAKGRTLYLERFIHGEIYRVRPDIKAVVHGHTPSLVTFSASSISVRPLFGGAAFIGSALPAFKVDENGGLISNRELGHALAEAMGKGAAILMRNHGVVVAGPTLGALCTRAFSLDINAQMQARILAMGDKEPIYLHPPAPSGEPNGTPDTSRDWDAYKRRVAQLMKQ